MADRTDIDALLIGALYGELTPADEARLTAHLESHPADRTALSDLTRTRAAIRDSRIFAFQWEPPHSVSALLLQEASRRAVRAPARAHAHDPDDSEGWFQRFVRAFTAHPAMAAAATLVLVFGVAGSLYLRGSMKMAESPPPATERVAAAPPESATADPVAAPAAAPAPAGRAGTAEGTGAADRAAADDPRTRRNEQAAAAAPPADDDADASGGLAQLKTKTADTGAKKAALSKPTRLDEPARPSKVGRGIELRKAEPSPKELKDSEYDGLAKLDSKLAEENAARREATRARDQQGPGGGAPPAPTVPAAPAPPPPQQAARPPASTAFEQRTAPPAQESANDKRFAQKPAAKGQAAAPSNNANSASPAVDGKLSDEKSKTLEWARKQREQVVSLVTQNRCDDAASAATEIYNRAPDYYAASIVTDRQIKPCLAYVNRQRERADRSRAAAKSAVDVQQAPVEAAPPRK